MSEWLKIYEALDLEQHIDHNTKERWVKCVSCEDFERLLTFTVKALSPQHTTPLLLDQLKENILLQLKNEAENE